MRIAVIGTGISGLGAAYFLRDHGVELFERRPRPGGHTHTIHHPNAGPVDTGFMVFNRRTYPNLVRLFKHLDVPATPTDMSFSVSHRDTGLEYASFGLRGYFAQWQNLVHTAHWRLLAEIIRFGRLAKAFLARGGAPSNTIRDFLDEQKLSARFRRDFLLPMTGAIWSTHPKDMLLYPARALLSFMDNHGLLDMRERLPWLTVVGGSQTYRDKLLHLIDAPLHLDTTVCAVTPLARGARLHLEDGSKRDFDKVVIATHADQALVMLTEAAQSQKRLLSPFRYTKNHAVLHCDPSVLPRQRAAWASWNYASREGGRLAATHYWMNNLQPLRSNVPTIVSIGQSERINPSKVHWKGTYSHPLFTTESLQCQRELPTLNSGSHIVFAGSYFGHGFHEDGLVSGMKAAEAILEHEVQWN